MSRLNFNLHEWNKEKMDELVRDEEERIEKENLEATLKQGIEQGIEKNMKAVILSMIANNIDIDTISKITNKSVNDINKIIEVK